MPATAELRCTGCGTIVIVLPSTVSAEVEADFIAHARKLETEEGKRFAVADATGAWTCPSCDQTGIVPSASR